MTTAESPADLTIDSSGTHLYVPMSTGSSPGGVQEYTIGADGTLAATGTLNQVGIGPLYVDIDPTGRFAYVSSAGTGGTGVYGFTIAATTGPLTAMTEARRSRPETSRTSSPSIRAASSATPPTRHGHDHGIRDQSDYGRADGGAGQPVCNSRRQPFFVSISPEAPGIRD